MYKRQDVGTIYELDLKNNLIIKKYNNRNLEASHTKSDLIEANNGKIYGISNEGGSCSRGSLFEYDTNLNKMVLLNSFCFGSDGWFPDSGMIQAIDGNLYGVIGSLSGTLLYKYDMINKTYTPIKNFQDYGLYGVGTVSYTHLDVYKRQTYYYLPLEEAPFQTFVENLNLGTTVKLISKAEIAQIPENSTVIVGFHKDNSTAVSYTHLDVYKRQLSQLVINNPPKIARTIKVKYFFISVIIFCY